MHSVFEVQGDDVHHVIVGMKSEFNPAKVTQEMNAHVLRRKTVEHVIVVHPDLISGNGASEKVSEFLNVIDAFKMLYISLISQAIFEFGNGSASHTVECDGYAVLFYAERTDFGVLITTNISPLPLPN